jgi:hypothetical protein
MDALAQTIRHSWCDCWVELNNTFLNPVAVTSIASMLILFHAHINPVPDISLLCCVRSRIVLLLRLFFLYRSFVYKGRRSVFTMKLHFLAAFGALTAPLAFAQSLSDLPACAVSNDQF